MPKQSLEFGHASLNVKNPSEVHWRSLRMLMKRCTSYYSISRRLAVLFEIRCCTQRHTQNRKVWLLNLDHALTALKDLILAVKVSNVHFTDEGPF